MLGGKYRLCEEIGRGGMGTVWRAEHLQWQAFVAVKLMTRSNHKPGARKRFEREVRLSAGLRSPHVVQVLDHGVDEATDTPYLVMELLEGESLAVRLRREGRLSVRQTLDLVTQLSRALTRAHAKGIIHRDLKPDNVFLVPNHDDTLVKVLDFGVAKWIAPRGLDSFKTRPGSLVGSPLYMSPEQLRTDRDIDHRADLWSLAVIVCECLTGTRPFTAPNFASLAVLLCGNGPRQEPSQLGPVPLAFDRWFERATARKIELRFDSVQVFTESLRLACSQPLLKTLSVATPTQSRPLTKQALGSFATVTGNMRAGNANRRGSDPGNALSNDSIAPTHTGRPLTFTSRQISRVGLGVGLGSLLAVIVLSNLDRRAKPRPEPLRPATTVPASTAAPSAALSTSVSTLMPQSDSVTGRAAEFLNQPLAAAPRKPEQHSNPAPLADSTLSLAAPPSPLMIRPVDEILQQATLPRKPQRKAALGARPFTQNSRSKARRRKKRLPKDAPKPTSPESNRSSATRVNGHRIRTLLRPTPQ